MNLEQQTYLERLARETARMSWPGRMGGILRKGAKRETEEYFATRFHIQDIWQYSGRVVHSFNEWHYEKTKQLARTLKLAVRRGYRPEAVATKLLNTFLHQLMKYDGFRGLYRHLHLPLDQEVFKSLTSPEFSNSGPANRVLSVWARRNPYKLEYKRYRHIQDALSQLLEECQVTGVKLESKIQLNALLWRRRGKARRMLGAGRGARVAGRRSLGTGET